MNRKTARIAVLILLGVSAVGLSARRVWAGCQWDSVCYVGQFNLGPVTGCAEGNYPDSCDGARYHAEQACQARANYNSAAFLSGGRYYPPNGGVCQRTSFNTDQNKEPRSSPLAKKGQDSVKKVVATGLDWMPAFYATKEVREISPIILVADSNCKDKCYQDYTNYLRACYGNSYCMSRAEDMYNDCLRRCN